MFTVTHTCNYRHWGVRDVAKVSCILHHWDVQQISAYIWARSAILIAGKRGWTGGRHSPLPSPLTPTSLPLFEFTRFVNMFTVTHTCNYRHWGGRVWRRCRVSYITGTSNRYQLTFGQGLLSL